MGEQGLGNPDIAIHIHQVKFTRLLDEDKRVEKKPHKKLKTISEKTPARQGR